MVTTIQIDEKLKKKLDELKNHQRETYNDLIERLTQLSSTQKEEMENLMETVEILSDPQTMREIAQGVEDYNKGKFKTLEQVKKELKLK